MHPCFSVWMLGLDIMQWAVCVQLISNAAVSYFQSALKSGTVKNITSVRSGTRVINVPWCHWIWNVQRMTHICPTLLLVVSSRQSGSFHSSQSPSMTEGKAEVMIERARSGRTCVFMCSVADHGSHHECSRQGSWSRPNVENEVELRCQKLPERTLANSCRCHCSLEHQVVATQCTLLKLAKMSSVAWQLIATRRLYRTKTMIRHVHFIWSTTTRYNILDASITETWSHVLNHSGELMLPGTTRSLSNIGKFT